VAVFLMAFLTVAGTFSASGFSEMYFSKLVRLDLPFKKFFPQVVLPVFSCRVDLVSRMCGQLTRARLLGVGVFLRRPASAGRSFSRVPTTSLPG
jgi:hypothetical protein